MAKRKATATWNGGLKGGNGTMGLGSGWHSRARSSFQSRFEEGTGTNPEETSPPSARRSPAATRCSCRRHGSATAFPPRSVEHRGRTVDLGRTDAGPTITTITLADHGQRAGRRRAADRDNRRRGEEGVPRGPRARRRREHRGRPHGLHVRISSPWWRRRPRRATRRSPATAASTSASSGRGSLGLTAALLLAVGGLPQRRRPGDGRGVRGRHRLHDRQGQRPPGPRPTRSCAPSTRPRPPGSTRSPSRTVSS